MHLTVNGVTAKVRTESIWKGKIAGQLRFTYSMVGNKAKQTSDLALVFIQWEGLGFDHSYDFVPNNSCTVEYTKELLNFV